MIQSFKPKAAVEPPPRKSTVFPGDIFSPTPAAAADFWGDFGLVRSTCGDWTLPAGVVVLEAREKTDHPALSELLKTMGVPSSAVIWQEDVRQAFYRVADPDLLPALARAIPAGVTLITEHRPIKPAGEHKAGDFPAESVDDLSELTAADVAEALKPLIDPVLTSNPLLPFSLRGESEAFKRMAVEARPLLGEVCLRGQVTMWYAAPNTGKTLVALSLILDAVREGRIAAANVFYVNADDNGQGFATKLGIMDDVGGNMLAPGFKGFNAPDLIVLLHEMADRNEARGALIIIDTVKKFVSLMRKDESSEFAQACRRVAMMGGTVLGLAHTTKNSNADGTPRYAGTTDLVDDADAAYTLRLLDGSGSISEKIVEFRCFKSRGDCAEIAAYSFAAEKGVSYADKLASVQPADLATVDEFSRIEGQQSDGELIDIVAACIREGINTKVQLAKEVAARTNVSGRAASKLIERYTGEDPTVHHWNFRRADRGAKVFELLT